ncbi:hypothetical protein Brsp06_02960 [Brucella sp. NBRC 13694]
MFPQVGILSLFSISPNVHVTVTQSYDTCRFALVGLSHQLQTASLLWQSDIRFRIFSGAEIFFIGVPVFRCIWDALLVRVILLSVSNNLIIGKQAAWPASSIFCFMKLQKTREVY